MKRILLGILVIMGAVGLSTFSANAQASRTWVSGVGDDANPCSRTAPCKTFAGTISKTATNGEINCIDPGGFGVVTITKSITIDCGGTFGSILNAGTSGIIINPTGACNVNIRNVAINGFGTGTNGVRILAPCNVLIENVQIFGSSQGIDAENTTGTLKLAVKDSTVHNISAGGILLKPAAGAFIQASLTRVNMHFNIYGVRAEARAKANVIDSVASDNSSNGFLAVSSTDPTEINVVNSMATNNGVNGINTSGAAATIRLLSTAVFDNANGINIGGGSVLGTTPDTNSIIGNTSDGAVNGNVTLQ